METTELYFFDYEREVIDAACMAFGREMDLPVSQMLRLQEILTTYCVPFPQNYTDNKTYT